MLNTVVESKPKCFTNISIFSEIMIVDHHRCGHDLREEIRIMVNFWLFIFRTPFQHEASS